AVLIGSQSMQNIEPPAIPHTRDLFRLDGQVAIVTGAAGLLGEQHALALAESGAHVVLTDLNLDLCEQRARQIAAQNPVGGLAIRGDVTRKESWNALLEQVLAEFGRVDILVNNAAFTNQSRSANYGAGFLEFPLEDWHQILEVNLTGSFLGCQTVGR